MVRLSSNSIKTTVKRAIISSSIETGSGTGSEAVRVPQIGSFIFNLRIAIENFLSLGVLGFWGFGGALEGSWEDPGGTLGGPWGDPGGS